LLENGLLLFDGLDEVPEAGRRRKCLLEAIEKLASQLSSRGRVLLTARPYAYADPQWHLPHFHILALAPFNQQQVDGFVQRWYEAVKGAMGWDTPTAQERGQRLAKALRDRPYLADLASRPLLLTLMATLHTSWGQLPEDRADLYEESVKLLLSRWQRARQVRAGDGQLISEPSIERALGIGESCIRDALQKLAFQTHARQQALTEQQDIPADIPVGDVLAIFTALLPDDVSPAVLLSYLDTRAGLLIGRREGVYAFPHRSFQEYLAVCHLANQPDFGEKLHDLVWGSPQWWREAFLLGVGKKRQGGLGDAVNVVNTLVPREPGTVRPVSERHWQAALLAGEALLELHLPDRAHGNEYYEAILERVGGWLVRLVEGRALSARERLSAGDVLGRLGDRRFDPHLLFLPQRHRGRPEQRLGFVEVPAGPFTMGSAAEDKAADEVERLAHTLELPLFFMGRYLVTNAQYRLFVAAKGYDTRDYWTEDGWAWRHGAEADLSVVDEGLRKTWAEWLEHRPAERRDRPFWWDDPQWGAPTRPVVGVTWYEALAYCRWLDERLRAAGALAWAPPDYFVRLPSEAEWEKAARGTQGLRWPWGNTWKKDRANIDETGLGQTSAVGLFPGGASPYGLLDMVGNVWQWTLSRWGRTSINRPDYGYPYRSEDGREDAGGPDWRVVRG
ncbi:MAG: NACHT domain-containing protein, partial [Chloroflexi bacterium]|nr:NACHT domain-containing protein [Chloroflexota bacterium]